LMAYRRLFHSHAACFIRRRLIRERDAHDAARERAPRLFSRFCRAAESRAAPYRARGARATR
jgi:hypothetical protein